MSSKSCVCLKYLIFIFNFIFFLIGCAILGLGIWLKVEKGEYVDISQYDYLTAANIAIAVGAVILVVSFLGCCGAIKEVAPMLMAFFVLLIIIFLLEIAVGVFAYVKRGELENELGKDLTEAMFNKYSRDDEEGITKAIDSFQEKFNCCGKDSFLDWRSSFYYQMKSEFPSSCCMDGLSNDKCPTKKEIEWNKVYRTKGCLLELKDFLKDNFLYIGASAIVFAIIQILGMVFSMVLYRSIR